MNRTTRRILTTLALAAALLGATAAVASADHQVSRVTPLGYHISTVFQGQHAHK